jgi:transposase-like protein
MAYPRDISIAEAIRSYGLPRNHRVHWSKARKDDVVRAVHQRAISFHEARERYLLSRTEFEQWEREYLASGGAAVAQAGEMQDA